MVDFITDQSGRPKAAVLDMTIWREIIAFLETVDEAKLSAHLQTLVQRKTKQKLVEKQGYDLLLTMPERAAPASADIPSDLSTNHDKYLYDV